MSAQAKGGAFGRLLGSASNELKVENDSKCAMKAQIDEACSIVDEWMKENEDFELAKQLSQTFAEEEKTRRALDIAKGESEALRVAVDERRRMKAEAEAKATMMRDDEELAKRLAKEDQ